MKEAPVKSSGSEHNAEVQPTMAKTEKQEFKLNNHSEIGVLPIQTKLVVGASDDPLEAEADAMADKVMRMPEQSFVQRKCASCENKEEEKIHRKPAISHLQRKCAECEEEDKIQIKPANTFAKAIGSRSLSSQLSSTKGSGQSLPNLTRSFMENRMGADFSNVRIHNGDRATNMNRQLGARAFTHGSDIYFNTGRFSPASFEGRHLIAHELTHVAQNNKADSIDMIRRDIITDPEPDDGFIRILSNATSLSGLVADGQHFNSILTNQDARTIMLFTQNGLDIYSMTGRHLNNYDRREGEPTISNSIWRFNSNGGLYQFGVRGEDIVMEERAMSIERFTEERQEIISQRDDRVISLLDDFTTTNFSEISSQNYLPGILLFGQVEATEVGTEEGEADSGAPDWAWNHFRQLRERLSEMRQRAVSSQTPPGDIILLRASDESRVALNVWLLTPREERPRYHGPRRRVPMTEQQPVDDILGDILDVTEQMRANPGNTEVVQEDASGDIDAAGRPRRFSGFGTEFGEEGETGTPYRFEALPAEIRGLSVQPLDGTGVFSIHLDYNQAASDLLGQVSWAFLHTYYRWEVWDITDTPEIQQRADEIRREGLDIEGEGGRLSSQGEAVRGNISRAIGELEERPDQIAADRREAMEEGRYLDVIANELNEELFDLEVVTALGSEVLNAGADLMADGQERSIHWQRQGVFVIRCIAVIDPSEPVRAPSVATFVVTVRNVEEISQEAIDAPAAEAAQLELRLLMLNMLPEGHPDRFMIPIVERQQRERALFATGTTIEIIQHRLNEKEVELRDAISTSVLRQHNIHDSRISRLEREVDTLRDQIRLARTRAGELHSASGSPAQRAHGVLISKVTGQNYPLLLQITEPELLGGRWRCILSDVTSRDAERYSGFAPNEGDIETAKLRAVTEAIERFAGAAGYGEGSLTIRLPQGGWFNTVRDNDRTITQESRPRDWTAARARLEELGQLIAILGLVVSSPALGLAGGLLSAAIAGDRMARRMENGTFRWDAQTAGDIIDIVSAGASIVRVGAVGALARIPTEGTGFILRATRSTLAGASRVAGVTDDILDVLGEIHTHASTADRILEINAAVQAGTMTRTQARRERATLITSSIRSGAIRFVGMTRGHDDASDRRQEGPGGRTSRGGDEAVVDPGSTRSILHSEMDGIDHLTLRHADQTDTGGTLRRGDNGFTLDIGGNIQLPVVETGKRGNGVAVKYEAGRLILEIDAGALPRHIAGHVETAIQLQRYQGVVGLLNRLISRVQQALGLGPGFRSRGFEARLERDKLTRILSDLELIRDQIQERAEHLNGDQERARNQEEREAITAEIEGIQAQLDRHMRDIDSTERGTGRIAAEDTTGAVSDPSSLDTPDLRRRATESDAAREVLRQRYAELAQTRAGQIELAALRNRGDSEAARALGQAPLAESSIVEHLTRDELAEGLERERQTMLEGDLPEGVRRQGDWLLEGNRVTPPNPLRFIAVEFPFNRLAEVFERANGVIQRLRRMGQETLLPHFDSTFLRMPEIQFIFSNEATFAAFRQTLLDLHAYATERGIRITQTEGWRARGGLRDFMQIDDAALRTMLPILLDQELSHADARNQLTGGGGSSLGDSGGGESGVSPRGTAGSRRPDFIDVDLERGIITIRDVTTASTLAHQFKTKFYVELMRAMLGGQGPAVIGSEQMRSLDQPSSESIAPSMQSREDIAID